MKKYLSLLLSVALCMSTFTFAASAIGETVISEPTPIAGNGNTYTGRSILYVLTGNKFKAATSIDLVNESILPNNPVVRYQARLYSNRGVLQLASSTESGYGSRYPLAETGEWQGPAAFSRGWVTLVGSDGKNIEMNLKQTAIVNWGRSFESENNIEAMAEAYLDDNNQYPVNQYGESYGPYVLIDIVGEEPDLISAVGVDGTEGFVRPEELCADYSVQPDEVVLIPLYDVNGMEISSFALNSMKEN